MDAKYVNPFIQSFTTVMPQLGFSNAQIVNVTAKEKEVVSSGVIVVLGIVGAIRGNVAYTFDVESAKKIASTMMMGMPIEEFDDMAKSALSELTNMLTATAATAFADMDLVVDISTPTMLEGDNITIKMSYYQILCAKLIADDVPIEINISFGN